MSSIPNTRLAALEPVAATLRPGETVRRGGTLALTGQGIKLVVQLGSMAVLARLLTPADFGLYSLVAPIAAFFMMFSGLGLTSATVYAKDLTDAEVNSLFWISTVIGIAIGAALFGVAPLAATFYDDPRLMPVLAVMASIFVFSGISSQYTALFQRHLRFKTLVAIEVGSMAAATVLGVVAAMYGFGYWSLILIAVATQVLGLAACVLLSTWQPSWPRWEARTATMARFGSSIAGFNVLNYFARNLDNLMIGKVWGLSALGFYGRAYSLLMAPLSQIIYPLNKVVVPVLTRINEDRDSYLRTYSQILGAVLLVCLPLVTWMLVARTAIIDVFLGPQWSEVAPIFLALGFAALVQPLNNSGGWLLLSQGRSGDILASGVMSCVVAVTSFACGLPWGARGVATAYAIGQIFIATPLLWWLVGRTSFVPVRDVFAIALPIWAAAAIAGLSFEIIQRWWPTLQSSAALLVCSFLWVGGVYLGALALIPRGRQLLGSCMPTRLLGWIRSS